jgi:hypothetical protein
VLPNWLFDSGVGSAMKKKDRVNDRMSECEYQDRLKSLLKNAFTTHLHPLRSLKTATKKRRALKEKATKNIGSSATASG